MSLSTLCFAAPSAEAQSRASLPGAPELEVIQIPGLKHPLKCRKGSDRRLCAMVLEEGEVAPIRGVLQTLEQAARGQASSEALQEKIRIEVDKVRREKDAEIANLRLQMSIMKDAFAQKEKLYEQAIEDVKPSWVEHPAFVASMTVVGIVAVGVAVDRIRGP